MALATLSITFTPQVTSNHRVCWKKTTDLTYDCSTIVAGTAGIPVTANITVTVVDDPCEPATFEGYVQPTCEPESSPLVRTDFPDVVYTCGACDCPVGYVYNPSTGFCESVTYATATPSSTTQVYSIVLGDTNGGYGVAGARLYQDITGLGELAAYQNAGGTAGYNVFSGPPSFSTGPIGTPIPVSTLNTVIADRLNNAGIWAKNSASLDWGDTGSGTELDWLPVRFCLDIPATQTYIFGIAGDNQARARLSSDNGATYQTLITLYSNTIPVDGAVANQTFQFWHMFPITLNAGSYILELSGWNVVNSDRAFAGEIYTLPPGIASDVWPTQKTMRGFMNSGTATFADLEPYILFSTENIRTGLSVAIVPDDYTPQPTFTCPGGGTLSTCYGGISCVTVNQQPCEGGG